MRTWVALLRGVNVGGKNILPMQALRRILDDLGYREPRTYLQSGNCAFRSPALDSEKISDDIGAAIAQTFGFRPEIMVLARAAMARAAADNPFREAADDPRNLYLYFLSKPVEDANLDALAALCTDAEIFSLRDSVFYLYAPNGLGRSKLAPRVERHLGVAATARNFRSVSGILELAGAVESGI